MFGNKLKYLRQQANLSQEELSKIFGVRKSTISNWENDHGEPSYEKLRDIAEYFDVSIDYLLGYEHMEDDLKELEQALIKNGLDNMQLEQALKIIDILKKDNN